MIITKESVNNYLTANRLAAEQAIADGKVVLAKITLVRDGLPIAHVFPKNTGGEATAHAAHLAIVGMNPDLIYVSNDTYMATTPTKIDGTPWESGEMAKVRAEGGPDAELVRDCLTTLAADQLGNVAAGHQTYRVINGDVVWDEPMIVEEGDTENGGTYGGAIVDSIRESFRSESLLSIMAKNGAPLHQLDDQDRTEFEMRLRCLVVKEVLGQVADVALIARNAVEERIIKEMIVNDPGGDYDTDTTYVGVHQDSHPLAGQTVKVHPRLDHNLLVDGADFTVTDWVDRMDPETSWSLPELAQRGNYAAKQYLARVDVCELPQDSEIVYGKIGGLGYIVHVSELER